MSQINWKSLMEHEGDTLLTWLHEAEEGCKRAIYGIWLFIVRKIPALFRHVLAWLQEKFLYACRVAVRVARLAGIFVAWLAIVFGPLVAYAGIVTGAWMVIALAGSVYGVQRQIKKHNNAWPFNKETSHARA